MRAVSQGYGVDLALHTLGWKAFQDLCAQVCAESFATTVSIYREAQDGGQDAVFLLKSTASAGQAEEATVQCKFSSKSDRRLRATDVDPEIPQVAELVASGLAHAYYLITSLGVDAPVAAAIKRKLAKAGVRQPHVLGREWLTSEIRKSARLRALVPRVYGLGDLSVIVDERCAEQTRALLGHLLPTLRAYVPTASHRQAVRVLSEHKIVLLLGAPATGKSMLASILATTAIDGEHHTCLKCDGPMELIERWNPHEKNRLYWIDDAFGANQLRTDYVDSWVSAIPKMKAAMEIGNRFILTSRSHIWNAAKPKLGTRNLALLENDTAVVHVGSLSPEEREQIVYNHLKAGNQSAQWKRKVKPHLADISGDRRLLPEIARRLGDSTYTKALVVFPRDLVEFVEAPAEFLKGTILELSDAQQAALTLIFIWRSRLPNRCLMGEETKLVADKYGVQAGAIVEALTQLDGTFVVRRRENNEDNWGLLHPTFADAITSILSGRPDLVELYLRGTRLETLLDEAVCEGAAQIPDAIVIPATSDETLISRLTQTPDEPSSNHQLFDFLRLRASDSVVKAALERLPDLLDRSIDRAWRVRSDVRLRFLARVQSLGSLPDQNRTQAAESMEFAATYLFDASFLQNDELMALFQQQRLVNLVQRLIELLDETLPEEIARLADDADANSDLEDHFEKPRDFISSLRFLFDGDLNIQDRLLQLDEQISDQIKEISLRKEDSKDDGSWRQVSPAKVAGTSKSRSIFSDIDD